MTVAYIFSLKSDFGGHSNLHHHNLVATPTTMTIFLKNYHYPTSIFLKAPSSVWRLANQSYRLDRVKLMNLLNLMPIRCINLLSQDLFWDRGFGIWFRTAQYPWLTVPIALLTTLPYSSNYPNTINHPYHCNSFNDSSSPQQVTDPIVKLKNPAPSQYILSP